MDLASLKTVLKVQQHGSIAAAARAMDMDPSSVSRLVAGIENSLGIRLFHRTTRKLTVTEEGQRYLTRIAPLLEEMDAAREDAVGARTRPTGVLRLTASVAYSCHVLVPLLPAFQAQYPEIVLDLTSSDANLDLVENGIDLAIRLAPAPKGDLVSTRLAQTRYKVVAHPEYLKTHGPFQHPNDLTRANCLRFSLPGLQNKWRFRQAAVDTLDVRVDGTFMTSNALTLHRAACLGGGIALLADWLIADDLQAGRLVDVFPNYQATLSDFDTAAWVLYPNRAFLPRRVRVMVDFLKAQMSLVP